MANLKFGDMVYEGIKQLEVLDVNDKPLTFIPQGMTVGMSPPTVTLQTKTPPEGFAVQMTNITTTLIMEVVSESEET